MSGFSSLNVGAQALYAAQRALDVTGQNVSNANTEGYSRQRVQQTARGASVVPALFTRSDGTRAAWTSSGRSGSGTGSWSPARTRSTRRTPGWAP